MPKLTSNPGVSSVRYKNTLLQFLFNQQPPKYHDVILPNFLLNHQAPKYHDVILPKKCFYSTVYSVDCASMKKMHGTYWSTYLLTKTAVIIPNQGEEHFFSNSKHRRKEIRWHVHRAKMEHMRLSCFCIYHLGAGVAQSFVFSVW